MVNDYDKFAKERQEELLKGTKKPHKFVEKPMMFSMMPNLTGKKVLMLGCGTGEETKILESFGASDLIGIDLSEESIRLAKEAYSNYEFIVGDMHSLPFNNESFDFVYSSLAIHYSDKPNIVYEEVNRILKIRGQFLFSVGHPLRWSSDKIIINNNSITLIGYASEKDEKQEVYGNYNDFINQDHLFTSGETLNFYVGPPSMHFKLLKKAGFDIEDFTESVCTEECKNYDLRYYNIFSKIPQFMAFLATKQK